jgi:hypothetical protein
MDLCNQISFGDEYFPMETILLKKILFFQDYNDTAVTLSWRYLTHADYDVKCKFHVSTRSQQ